jgi:hypothetical protein
MTATVVDRAASDVAGTLPDSERAVARLRPAPRPRPGVMEGFMPLELASRGPRQLRATDEAPLPPAPIIEVVDNWADRETLFGDA